MVQNEIRTKGNLLREDGSLAQEGFSWTPQLSYNREAVKEQRRIKESERYYVTDGDYAISVYIANLGTVGVATVNLYDHVFGQIKSQTAYTLLPQNKISFGKDLEFAEASFKNHQVDFSLTTDAQGMRCMKLVYEYFDKGSTLYFDCVFGEDPEHSLYYSSTWPHDVKRFFYSRAAMGYVARGSFRCGRQWHGFNEEYSLAGIELERGVWPGDVRWKTVTALDVVPVEGEEGKTCVLGLMLGEGRGTYSMASESALFVDGVGSKFGEVIMNVPERNMGTKRKTVADEYDCESSWPIYDDEGSLSLEFTPSGKVEERVSMKVFEYDSVQLYGTLSGWVKFNGEKIQIEGLNAGVQLARRKA